MVSSPTTEGGHIHTDEIVCDYVGDQRSDMVSSPTTEGGHIHTDEIVCDYVGDQRSDMASSPTTEGGHLSHHFAAVQLASQRMDAPARRRRKRKQFHLYVQAQFWDMW